MNFRSDLNGLRAVAVLLVVLFHLDFPWLKGGFLGVDVFLVLSGYFISRNIIADLEADRFSFQEFYRKRIRRILPAQLFTILVTLIAGYCLLIPQDLQDLGRASLYAASSVVNIYFFNHTGYFDTIAASRPTMQMWSLSLEEQFYFIWPLLLLLFHRSGKVFVWILLLVTLTSLVLASAESNRNPSAAFFLLPYRVFEFSLGTICVVLQNRFPNRMIIPLLDVFALAGIVISCILLSNHMPMPGLYSLIPCGCTMLLILTGNSKVKNVLLSNKLAAIMGSTSYSAYLIHWPLIVYYKYYILRELELTEQVLLGLITFLLAWLMWKFIENRFRKHSAEKRDPVWIWAPVCLAVVCGCSFLMVKAQGFPHRFPDLAKFASAEELEKEKARYWSNTDSTIRLANASGGHRRMIIMGNSHANDLAYALINNGLKADITFLPTTFHCYNFGTPREEQFADECAQTKKRNLNDPAWHTAEVVYLHDDWAKADLPNLQEFLTEIRKLTHAPVYVFGPKMTFTIQALNIVQAARKLTPEGINTAAKDYMNAKSRISLNQQLEQLLNTDFYRSQQIHFIDLLKVQCGDEYSDCRIISPDSRLLYFDSNHFTELGATTVGAKLKLKYPFLF